MKVFGYARVSSVGQVAGDGPVRQEAAIRNYAAAQGYEVERIFEDGVSGTKEDRPALAELMLSMETNGHGIKTVIIEKLDRLARDLMVQESIIKDFRRSGFDLISVHEGPGLMCDDPTRKLLRQFMGAIAEYDKTMTVAKLKAARGRKKKATGKCEGRKGYQELMPEVWEVAREAKDQGATYEEVAVLLNGSGFETVAGKAFSGRVVQDMLRFEKRRKGI